MKKLFIFSGAFFLIVLVFLGVYNFAFRHNVSIPVANQEKRTAYEQEKITTESEAPAHSVAFEQILGEDVLFPSSDEMGVSLFYYSPRDNALKSVAVADKSIAIQVQGFPGTVTRVLWSPNHEWALVAVQIASGKTLWHSVDLKRKQVTALKPEMSRLAWTSVGDRIAYVYTDPANGERSLNLSYPDGSNWTKLTDLGNDSDYFLSTVPQSSQIGFWRQTDGLSESALEVVSISGGGRHTVVPPHFGADFLWSTDSRRILVQSVTERGGNRLELGLIETASGKYQDLFAPTLVSKAAWSKDGETFYYALPSVFPDRTVLPNDYFTKPVYSKDTFWKMNVRTGKKERLVALEEMKEVFDATSLFLSSDETSLFFVDRVTKKLFRITL